MDEVPRKSSSVSVTRSIFGESIGKGGRKLDKIRARDVLGQENLSPEVKQSMVKLNERKATVDKERAGAESELSRARAIAKELERQIEQTKARTLSKRSEVQAMQEATGTSNDRTEEEHDDAAEYEEVVRELDRAKQELRWLRQEVRSAAEAKAKAESDIVASAISIQSNLRAADEMKRLVDEANEEHVLVELARIEAERERREIDAQRRAEAERFAAELDAARAQVRALREDAARATDMEAMLAATNADVEALQSEMELVRAMERNKKSARNDEARRKRKQEEEAEAAAAARDRALLQAAEAELDAARKELEGVKAEGFQFMASMDGTRTEIMRVSGEVTRLRAAAEEADARVQHLNGKLLKARGRLDGLAAAGDRSAAIVSNMASALLQLRAEADAAREEAAVAGIERRCVTAEAESAAAEAAATEARVREAVRELEAAKAAEAAAMKRLRVAVEGAMQARAAAARRSSGRRKKKITISRFEYEYLTGRAALVRVVADKKVAAAQAWVKELKAGEKEMEARAEAAEKVAAEMKAREAEAAAEAEGAAGERKALEQELYDLNAAAERDEALMCEYPRRRRPSRVSATARRARARRSSVSSASGVRNTWSPSFTIKRKKKVMPSIFKLIKQRKEKNAS
ncbi:unnamed protein product [Urochloa humidicola]